MAWELRNSAYNLKGKTFLYWCEPGPFPMIVKLRTILHSFDDKKEDPVDFQSLPINSCLQVQQIDAVSYLPSDLVGFYYFMMAANFALL